MVDKSVFPQSGTDRQLCRCCNCSSILLYIPNIVDYMRILLIIMASAFFHSQSSLSLMLYILSVLLDAVDGYLARKFNQISDFGAWLDVAVDNFGRSMLWCRLWDFGWVISSLEWLTFVCTHSKGREWKSDIRGPWLILAIMANNFRSTVGCFAVGSLVVLPIWLFALHKDLLVSLRIPWLVQHAITLALTIGRSLCVFVEMWCIYLHVMLLSKSPTVH